MQMIASRELSSKPGAVWSKLAAEGSIVVTRDGRPIAIVTPTSPETMIEDFQEIAFSQARRAARNLRASAAKTDVASLSLEDIEGEIQSARKITQ